jgi:hypothetical protein
MTWAPDENDQDRLWLGFGPWIFQVTYKRYEDHIPNLVVDSDVEPDVDYYVAGLLEESISSGVMPKEVTAPPAHKLFPQKFWLDSQLASTKLFSQGQRYRTDIMLNGRYGSPIVSHPRFNLPIPETDVRRFDCTTGRKSTKVLIGCSRTGIPQAFDIYGMGWSGMVLAERPQAEV